MASFTVERLQSPLEFDDFVSQFKVQNGLKKLGSGVFSEVVAHPKQKDCYKIGRIGRSGEDAYLEFLKMIRNKTTNPLFQKIHTLTFFKNKDAREQWYVVRMEKLHPLWAMESKRVKPTPMAKIVRSLLEGTDQRNLKQFTDFLKALSITAPKGKQLMEDVRVIDQSFKLTQPDLHDGNMMLRTNGELVITDPIAYLKPKSKRK
jgi:hypothetical protein